MIVLNDYKDLLPYMKLLPEKKSGKMQLVFEFKENEILGDVVFDFNAVLWNFFGEIGYHQIEKISKFLYGVRAKNIVFNYDCDCDFVECENLIVKKMLSCKHTVEVKKNIDCNILACESIMCEKLDGVRVRTSKIDCKNMKVRGLAVGGMDFCYIKADDVISEEE